MAPSSEKSFSGKGLFPPQYAFTLLLPLRNIFLSPRKLIQRLELQEDHTVLEIGPGPGYFSTHVARALKTGKLVVLDIQQEMVDLCRKRLEKRGLTNVEYKLADGNRLDFASGLFDRIFLVTVLGEIENREAYMLEMHRILKPGGVLSISELAGDPDKLSLGEVESLVTAYGFKVSRVFGSRRNFTVNCRKPATADRVTEQRDQ